jgi:hypothetical protein
VPLDHLFLFVDDAQGAEALVNEAGLAETYRREHVGQGTANLCCAFDDAFLEFLWVTDPELLSSAPIAPTRLHERSRWRQGRACPFGFAVRGDLHAPTWDFRPPYLPDLAIRVLCDAQDPNQPFVFAFPGATAPTAWPVARQRGLQRSRGLTSLRGITISGPTRPTDAIADLSTACGIGWRDSPTWGLEVTAAMIDGRERSLRLR